VWRPKRALCNKSLPPSQPQGATPGDTSEDEIGDDSSAEQTGLIPSSRNAKHKKRQREDYRLLKDAVPTLLSFYEKVSGMLNGEREAESDDEVNGAGVAGVLRRI
jgi:hypothetical protein